MKTGERLFVFSTIITRNVNDVNLKKNLSHFFALKFLRAASTKIEVDLKPSQIAKICRRCWYLNTYIRNRVPYGEKFLQKFNLAVDKIGILGGNLIWRTVKNEPGFLEKFPRFYKKSSPILYNWLKILILAGI